VQVNVSNGHLTAVFCIDMLRTPYFFADRDIEYKGSKIFHIVRAHRRVGAGGNETFVKSHFRGLREFVWNGYSVRITLAGKHHADLLDANFGSYEEGILNDENETIGIKELADKFVKSYH